MSYTGPVPLVGYLPDADPTLPGVITVCDGLIPTERGMRTAYSAVNVGYPAVAAAVKGAAVVRLVDNSARMFAGTSSNIYEWDGSAWTSRGSGYTNTTGFWRFVAAGNVTIAVDKSDTPQYSVTSGAFSALAAMPKARFVCASNEFILAADINDGTDKPNGWACSAAGNYTSWAVSLSTQANTGILTDVPGAFTGMKTLGEAVVFYKKTGMYYATYIGPPLTWGFRRVSETIGAVSNESIVSTGTAHYFVGASDFFVFTGNVPEPIGAGIKNWFFADVDQAKLDLIQGLYDKFRGLIYWWYPSRAGGGALDRWIAYDTVSKRWGAGAQTIESVLEAVTTGTTYDGFGLGLTFDTLPNYFYDSTAWASGAAYPALFNSSHALCSYSGGSGTSSFKTGYIGDDVAVSRLRRVQPRWSMAPTAGTLVHEYTNAIGTMPAAKTGCSMAPAGWFDVMHAARWHRASIFLTGTAEFATINYDMQRSGVNAR
jgi:hypothetical protein